MKPFLSVTVDADACPFEWTLPIGSISEARSTRGTVAALEFGLALGLLRGEARSLPSTEPYSRFEYAKELLAITLQELSLIGIVPMAVSGQIKVKPSDWEFLVGAFAIALRLISPDLWPASICHNADDLADAIDFNLDFDQVNSR